MSWLHSDHNRVVRRRRRQPDANGHGNSNSNTYGHGNSERYGHRYFDAETDAYTASSAFGEASPDASAAPDSITVTESPTTIEPRNWLHPRAAGLGVWIHRAVVGVPKKDGSGSLVDSVLGKNRPRLMKLPVHRQRAAFFSFTPSRKTR